MLIPALIGALGSIVASGIGGFFSTSNTNKTVDAAEKNTEDTNATNERIANKNNATSIQLQREMNDFNLAQWNRTNEYNSTTNQLQRWTDAGLNPNSFNPSSSVAANPVQQLSIPNLTTPTLQNSADAIMRGGEMQNSTIWQLANSFKNAAETAQISQNVEKTQADIVNSLTDAKVKEYLAPSMSHLNWSSASEKSEHITLMRSQCMSLAAGVSKINQDIEESKSKIALMDEETAKLAYENLGAPERWKIVENTMANDLLFTREQINYFKASFNLRLGNLSAQNEYLRSQSALSDAERQQVEFTTKLLNAQNPEDALRAYSQYAASIVENNALSSREQREALEYANSTFARTTNAIGTLGSGIGAALNGVSSIKGKPSLKGKTSTKVDSDGKSNFIREDYIY